MTRTTRTTLAAVALGVSLGVGALHASDPVGVYAVIDRVSVTAGNGAPTTAQIWGTFAVAVTPPSNTYKPEEAYGKVRKGYLLFTCTAEQTSVCAAEWNDLKSLAGTGTVAGFGTRWGTAPRVRTTDEAASAPDTYRVNVGVVKIGRYGDYPTIVAALKTATSEK